MKIYLDACCLNRPFDDQDQHRIRLESEAILIIIDTIYRDKWEWIGSETLIVELENTPDIDKRNHLKELASNIHTIVNLNDREMSRAEELQRLGFKAYDAMHIACSETANVDIFLTTDDKLLKMANRERERLNIKVANPINWIMEII